MKFFGDHPDSSKKQLPKQFDGYAANSSHPGFDVATAYYTSKKMSNEELDEKIEKEKNPYKSYGYLRELKDRRRLVNLKLKRKLESLANLPKDLKNYDKAPSPEEAIGTPALAAGGLGIGMMGLQKAFYTSKEEVTDVLEGMGKKHNLTVATRGTKAKSVGLNISKDYGKIIPTLIGKNIGPHYEGTTITGKSLPYPNIATTPNVGVAAHEMGHAINQEKFLKKTPKLKRVYNLAYQRIPMGPIKNVPLLAIPAVAAALYAGKKGAEGKDAKFIPEFVEKHPEVLIGAGAAPMLVEEGSASVRALKGIGQHYKGIRRIKELGKAVATLTPAYGTYAVAAALPIIGIKAYQKHIKEKKKLEKKYKVRKRNYLPDKLL
jgi:hypothetical protein